MTGSGVVAILDQDTGPGEAVYWTPDGTHLLLRVDPVQDLILVRLK